jgi:hypothetical protein
MAQGHPLANVRLPSPPEEYQTGYLNRLVNTLELLQRTNFFAVSSGINSSAEQAEATAWFVS